jgi:hypothetical protein
MVSEELRQLQQPHQHTSARRRENASLFLSLPTPSLPVPRIASATSDPEPARSRQTREGEGRRRHRGGTESDRGGAEASGRKHREGGQTTSAFVGRASRTAVLQVPAAPNPRTLTGPHSPRVSHTRAAVALASCSCLLQLRAALSCPWNCTSCASWCLWSSATRQQRKARRQSTRASEQRASLTLRRAEDCEFLTLLFVCCALLQPSGCALSPWNQRPSTTPYRLMKGQDHSAASA